MNSRRVSYTALGFVFIMLVAVRGYDPLPHPTVTSLTPTSGPTSGGTTVTFQLNNPGACNVKGVDISGETTKVTNWKQQSSTALQITTPAHAKSGGIWFHVIFRGPDNASDTASKWACYNPPYAGIMCEPEQDCRNNVVSQAPTSFAYY